MKDKILKELLDNPLLTSIFIVDFAIILLHRPPVIFSLVMVGALVGISMYYGQKLALFQEKAPKK
jgi:hypothetical protein